MTVSEETPKPKGPDQERLFDLIFFAPIGLALRALDDLPALADRGRTALEANIREAKIVGRMAVQQASVEMQRIGSQLNDLSALMRSGALRPNESEPDGPSAPARPVPAPPSRSATGAKRHEPAPDSLGIAGYESLSASQVVARLDGLDGQALEAVRAYEASTRARSTVLGRISQLQG